MRWTDFPWGGIAWGVPFAVLVLATLYDLRTRRVPVWLTGGGLAAGVVGAALMGPAALRGSLAGAAAGGLVFFPFVLLGWLGGADALLLATVGAWQGWRIAIWAAWWTALAGAMLAIVIWVWRRRQGDIAHGARAAPFPYVPAILAGTAAALFFSA